ncbi:hypothetical protein CYMTET_11861 [Cymbomonas tetramitiformis]|uniref:Uncharacterized protein n=1 Tax=Cymbomonas tetramitiformis TaxID=36881 RepID=A0AAE0LCM6_9CHLO|nr:hypothetical protein CYMTET_11861 [Cymbomonas tetramitiformis]
MADNLGMGGVTQLFMAFHKNKKVVLHDRVMDETSEVTTTELYDMFSSMSTNPWAAMKDFAEQWARTRLESLTRATNSEFESIKAADSDNFTKRKSFGLRRKSIGRRSHSSMSPNDPAVESAAPCRSGASLWRKARQPLTAMNFLGGLGTKTVHEIQSPARPTKSRRQLSISRWEPAVSRISKVRSLSFAFSSGGGTPLDPLGAEVEAEADAEAEACKLREVLTEQPGAQASLNQESPEIPKAQREIWPKRSSASALTSAPVSASASGDSSQPRRERDTCKGQPSLPRSLADNSKINRRHLRNFTSEEPTATPSLQTTTVQKTGVERPPNLHEERLPAQRLAPLPGGNGGVDTSHHTSGPQDEKASREGPGKGWMPGMLHGTEVQLTMHEPYQPYQLPTTKPPPLVHGKALPRHERNEPDAFYHSADRKDVDLRAVGHSASAVEGNAKLLNNNSWTDSADDAAVLRRRAQLQNISHIPGKPPPGQEPSEELLLPDPPTRHLADHLSRSHAQHFRPAFRVPQAEGLLPGRRKEAALPRSCGVRSLVMQQYISTMNAQTHTTREVWPLPQNQSSYAHVLCTSQARSKT